MTAELDLSDPVVREMADHHHQPDEAWSAGGILLSVYCQTCGHAWPCPTRLAITERDSSAPRDEDRDGSKSAVFGRDDASVQGRNEQP